jgi:hypothetical protein
MDWTLFDDVGDVGMAQNRLKGRGIKGLGSLYGMGEVMNQPRNWYLK